MTIIIWTVLAFLATAFAFSVWAVLDQIRKDD